MTLQIPTDSLIVDQPTFDMSAPERQLITFDYTADLAPGETITSVAGVTLVDDRSRVSIPTAIDGAAVIDSSSKMISQWVLGTPFEENVVYRLCIVASTTFGRRLAPYLLIEAIF